MITVGYAVLNLFNKRSTLTPATPSDTQISLNEGSFQLPLHTLGPDASLPLTATCLDHIPRVPGSWLLARVSSRDQMLPVYSEGGYTDKQRGALSKTETYVLDSHRQRPIKQGDVLHHVSYLLLYPCAQRRDVCVSIK